MLLATPALAQTGGVGIGTTTPDASAALDIRSTGKGLLPPRLTYAQRTGISNAAAGLLVYQSDASTSPAAPAGYYYYTGTQWLPLLSQGDNLGNHAATQSLNLAGNALVGTGDNISGVGVGVRADGGLNLGQNSVSNNIYLGYQAGQSNTTGRGNYFAGYRSGFSNTTGDDNVFVGYRSGYWNTSGAENVFIGTESGGLNTDGIRNIFVGMHSGLRNTSGGYNVFSGYQSGLFNTTGQNNVFSGPSAGVRNTSGNRNVFVGPEAGTNNAVGNNNTALGSQADLLGDALTNATAIGYNAKVSQSNSLVLGGTGANAVRVGIGTTAPAVALDVQSSGSLGSYDFAFYARNGNAANTGYASNANSDVSIRASGRMVATEFNATSDRRLKTVIGLSDAAQDLALLRRLRIIDYQMRDRVQFGPRPFKKVIAQEVEQVFPQAVQQQTAFLPDVYQVAAGLTALPGDSLLLLRLPAGLAEAAAAGQRLKLLGPAGEVLARLARPAAAGATTLTVRGAGALAAQPASQVFVYGLERADVRTVDYEALSMLNVSATQELARKVQALEQQNAALRQQATAAAAQADTRATAAEASLAKLEARLRALESQQPTAAQP
ncbi:hypothetical protein GCM10027048_36550 [Hymenobacter coalescens]